MYDSPQVQYAVARYQRVKGNNNLESVVFAMLSGVTSNADGTTNDQIKELLFTGGKTKQRSQLRDDSITEITVPRVFNDEEIYLDSIIDLVNRYLTNIKPRTSENQIKSLVIKLFHVNVIGFYSQLKLPTKYREIVERVFSNLIAADEVVISRFRDAIDSGDYLEPKLPAKFEYKARMGASDIYNEYIKPLNEPQNSSQNISDFIASMGDYDDSEYNVDEEEYVPESEGTKQEITVDDIPRIIQETGYLKILNTRTDKILRSTRLDTLDKKVVKNLKLLIDSFSSIHGKLTRSVEINLYCAMFGMAVTTYKENKVIVLKEISEISNSEEFAKFSEILLS